MRKGTYTPPKIVLMRDTGGGAVSFLSRNPKTLDTQDFEAAQSFITTEAAWEACHHLYDRGCGDWVVVAACTEAQALRTYKRAEKAGGVKAKSFDVDAGQYKAVFDVETAGP